MVNSDWTEHFKWEGGRSQTHMCSRELKLTKANWKFKVQVQSIYIYSVWNSASLSEICTRASPNGSAVLSSLDNSHRVSGNFSSSGFWQTSEVGIMLWQRRLNQLLFKRLFLNTYDSSINLCRLNWEEASPFCYCSGTERSLTVVSHRFPQHGTGLSWDMCQTSALPDISATWVSCQTHVRRRIKMHYSPHSSGEIGVAHGTPHGSGI